MAEPIHQEPLFIVSVYPANTLPDISFLSVERPVAASIGDTYKVSFQALNQNKYVTHFLKYNISKYLNKEVYNSSYKYCHTFLTVRAVVE